MKLACTTYGRHLLHEEIFLSSVAGVRGTHADSKVEVEVKSTSWRVLAILLLWTTVACTDRGTNMVDPIQVPPGGFLYRGYDETGAEAVTGWLLFSSESGESVTGTWELQQVGSPGNIGPQIGRGTFEGSRGDQGTVNLDLNPGWVDNNVFLSGRFQGDIYSGRWAFSGFEGVLRDGTFDARRR